MEQKVKIKNKADLINFLRNMTKFEKDVLVATFEIPQGKVSTYKRIVKGIGRPKAYRAVGNALNKNKSKSVSCHRVVKSNGEVGGFARGSREKIKMLKKEGIDIKKGKIIGFEKKHYKLKK